MEILKGKNIFLRALEPEDIDYLFSTENNEDFWEISNTSRPFSKHILSKYLEEKSINIIEMDTHISQAPISGSPLFNLNAAISIPGEIDGRNIQSDLSQIAQDLGVEIHLSN